MEGGTATSTSPAATPTRRYSRPLTTPDSRFSCNICLEAVTEPVVTQCGHLFCWPCLYRWLEPGMLPGERQSLHGASPYAASLPGVDETRRVCPVCKAPCCVPSLVPVYVRGNNDDGSASAFAGEEKEGMQFSPNDAANFDDGNNDIDGVDDNVHEMAVEEEEWDWEENEPGNDVREEEEAPPSASPPPPPPANTEEDDPTAPTTGLRQRLRFRTNDSEISDNNNNNAAATPVVPARPAANSPARPVGSRNSNNNSSQQQQPTSPNRTAATTTTTMTGMTPLSPAAVHPASLSHGLVISFQQAMRNQQTSPHNSNFVPPLHRREGHGNAALYQQQGGDGGGEVNSDPDATEFLSRILLLLGSFVILCLLLF